MLARDGHIPITYYAQVAIVVAEQVFNSALQELVKTYLREHCAYMRATASPVSRCASVMRFEATARAWP